jgi:hypothetical protein
MKDNISFVILISSAFIYANYTVYLLIKKKLKKTKKETQNNAIVSKDPFREEYKKTLIQECEKRLKKAKFMNENDEIIFFKNKLKKLKN